MKNKYANEFIEIKGNRLLSEQLIQALNSSCWKVHIFLPAAQHYRLACRIIADHVYDYMKGETQLKTSPEYFKEYKMSTPNSGTYPGAIAEMIENLRKDFNVNPTEILMTAVKNTVDKMKEMEKENEKKKKRCDIVEKIMEGAPLPEETEARISAILRIRKGKSEEASSYMFTAAELDREARASQLWCGILTAGEFNEFIPFYLLKALVQERFIDESDAGKLLRDNGIKKDWEWYSEDFLGSKLMDTTDVSVSSVLAATEPLFMDILNIRQTGVSDEQ